MDKPSFSQVRNELVARLYGLAFAQDCIVRDGAPSLLLGVDWEAGILSLPAYKDFDLTEFKVADSLTEVHDYAFHGETRRFIRDDNEDGAIGRLQTFIAITNQSFLREYTEEVTDELDGEGDERSCGLEDMVRLAAARYALDNDSTILLSDIALLADMNERSVRNALHAEGDAALLATRNAAGEMIVERTEALRWLRGRRGFMETVWVDSVADEEIPVPEALQPAEIFPFVLHRLQVLYPRVEVALDGNSGSSGSSPNTDIDAAASRSINGRYAAQSANWSEERLNDVLERELEAISPEDCPALSRALRVDGKWLTAQVMKAKFPEAMSLISPGGTASSVSISPMKDEEKTLEVVLTAAGIRNGYFDIERRYADRFFPSDCFGDRGAGAQGKSVELRHDGPDSPYNTDIRVKSGVVASPRKRFGAYFSAKKVRPGDVIRIRRLDERVYELTHISK